jgi:hypothetical protein
MYGREMCARVWQGNCKERDNFEDLGIDRRVILKWNLK